MERNKENENNNRILALSTRLGYVSPADHVTHALWNIKWTGNDLFNYEGQATRR